MKALALYHEKNNYNLKELMDEKAVFVNLKKECIQKADGTVLYDKNHEGFAYMYNMYENQKEQYKKDIFRMAEYCQLLSDPEVYSKEVERIGQHKVDSYFSEYKRRVEKWLHLDKEYSLLILERFYSLLYEEGYLFKTHLRRVK